MQQFVRNEKNLPRDPEPNWRAEERLRALLKEIRVIVGGNMMVGSSKKVSKTYLRMVQSVQISRRPLKATKIDSPTINFTEEDVR